MRAAIFAHLRGNIIAYVALFAALGGTSYAAVSLKPGSVKSAALARGAVTHAKLARNSVTSVNVAQGSLTGADFKKGTLVKRAVRGPKGATGATGAAGPAGPPAHRACPGARASGCGPPRVARSVRPRAPTRPCR